MFDKLEFGSIRKAYEFNGAISVLVIVHSLSQPVCQERPCSSAKCNDVR